MAKKKAPRIDPSSLALPYAGADTHAHLDSESLWPHLADIMERAKKAGVAHIGQVFLSPKAYEEGHKAFEIYPEVFFLLGIHPCYAHEFSLDIVDEIKAIFLKEARLKAVGEVGLDAYWKECPIEVQEAFFRRQIGLARELGKPLAIHSRDTAAQTVQVLLDEGMSKHPVLWHCFQGDAIDHLDTIITHGWEVSIPGIITYKANEYLREAVKEIPLTHLHIETDCPYLAPMPWRGTNNEPSLVAFVAESIAKSRQIDTAEVWTQCGQNAVRFFGLQ